MKTFFKIEMIFLVALICVSCKREERTFRVPPPKSDYAEMVPLDSLHAGGPMTNMPSPAPISDYKETAYAISQGQQLFSKMNCAGCHAHGGGGMGVPLMDDKWIYGSEPQQIFATIVQGRPKGMPSYSGRLTKAQVWELAAYVRSLSGNVRRDAAPGREDHMQAQPPPNSIERAQPKNVSSPE